MNRKLYKYIGPEYIDKIFSDNKKISLKCSYPKDFNDPYELFLTIDFNEQPEVLAFYKDVIGELPQLPITCFSRSPSIIPMWAHYGQNLEGFTVELDEPTLQKSFPESGFGDVDYKNKTDESIKDILYRAYEIGKFRYFYFLQKAVLSAAFYTKNSCWGYELERRMIIKEAETFQRDGLILIGVPNNCISAIISGPRASAQTVKKLKKHAKKIGCSYFEMKIGRSSSVPFFFDTERTPHIYGDERLKECSVFCATCHEPIIKNMENCSWCQINESHKHEAAARNSFRMLSGVGLLKDYIKGMEDITHKK